MASIAHTAEIAEPAGAEESARAAVSWGAVIAGGVTAAALTLVLLAFGTGLGLAVVSPWPSSGISAKAFSITSGVYLIVVAVIASSVGGYIAGRLRTRWVGAHTHEVFFRDTAHGFLAWSLATVIGASVLASAAAQLVGATAVGMGAAASQSRASGPVEHTIDNLLRSNPAVSRLGDSGGTTRDELARLLSSDPAGGFNLAAPDRAYVTQVVAARTGLNQAEAEKRVAEVLTEARNAADTARKGAMHLALWLAASLLAGALAASLTAIEGGALRDGTWKHY